MKKKYFNWRYTNGIKSYFILSIIVSLFRIGIYLYLDQSLSTHSWSSKADFLRFFLMPEERLIYWYQMNFNPIYNSTYLAEIAITSIILGSFLFTFLILIFMGWLSKVVLSRSKWLRTKTTKVGDDY